jgi:hypothetical protein
MPADSTTPLIRKLGIKEAMRILFVNAPTSFECTLGPLPHGVELCRDEAGQLSEFDVIVCFAHSEAELQARFAELAGQLTPAGGLWIAWPKKASGVATDLSDDVVRRLGLAHGLVDNKICSIDAIWSGQRFVVRLKDRPKRQSKRNQ